MRLALIIEQNKIRFYFARKRLFTRNYRAHSQGVGDYFGALWRDIRDINIESYNKELKIWARIGLKQDHFLPIFYIRYLCTAVTFW